ncbi:MAG: hypothetical protein Hyperionvirus9_2 [Hyperionvirus sp.]|uniref:Uncharacterized protein n=1 Tax=Hyperionvirus sp. TaxID=2487770 RepID=A0A3G5A8M2_9VIRU|nr:MAG: hypothetical protein Hyperionvirus9_2 [Hyperionvirus sp.]
MILCAAGREGLMIGNPSDVIYDHLFDCDDCDVTDNSNNNSLRIRLLKVWKEDGTEVMYEEVDGENEDLESALNSYYCSECFNPFGEVEGAKIRLLNIIEEDHMYNESVLVLSFVPFEKKEIKVEVEQEVVVEEEVAVEPFPYTHCYGAGERDAYEALDRNSATDEEMYEPVEAPVKKKPAKILVKGKKKKKHHDTDEKID